MSCKCKNIIENFQGGTIPLDTIFNGNVQICGPGKSLNVSNIDGCSPTTIGSQSGCTSATTTVLIVSGKTNFSCDVNVAHGGIFSGGTNIMDMFTTVPGTDINVTGGTYSNSTGCATFTTNQGDNFDICGFMTGFTNNFVTGGTFNSSVGVLTLLNNNGNTFDISGFTTTNTNPTFTGNTSATCINELWVSNISGCSPVTIGTELITEAGLKTDFIRYNSSADTMFIGSDFSADTRIELRRTSGDLKIWGDGDVNLYSQDNIAKVLMSDGIVLEGNQHTFLHTSPNVRLKRTVTSADTVFDFVSPGNVSSTRLYYKGVDSTFRINTFNGVTSEEALKIDLNQNVELSSNLNVSGDTNTLGTISSGGTNLDQLFAAVSSNTDTFVTGFTYNNANTFTISDNSGSTFNATINTVTGLTINGNLSATTISATTYFGDGSNLTGLTDRFITGATLVGTTLNLKRNNGLSDVTVDLSPLSGTSVNNFVTGGTFSSGSGILSLFNNDGNTFNVSGFTSGGGSGGAFTVAGDNGTPFTIVSGDTLQFVGQSGLNIGVADPEVRIAMDYSGPDSFIMAAANGTSITVDAANDKLVIYDDDATAVKYINVNQLPSGGGTFTGNTSATCINELWVSNISGCSPVTIGTEVVVKNNLNSSGVISSDTIGLSKSWLSSPPYIELFSHDPMTKSLYFNKNTILEKVFMGDPTNYDPDSLFTIYSDVAIKSGMTVTSDVEVGNDIIAKTFSIKDSGITSKALSVVPMNSQLNIGESSNFNKYFLGKEANVTSNFTVYADINATRELTVTSGITGNSLNVIGGSIFSGGTNLDQLFAPISATDTNIYDNNGNLSSDRTVSLEGNKLDFSGVTGNVSVTDGHLTITSSGTNSSDTVFLVQDSLGNHIIEGLDTGQVHVGDLINSALPTNPTLMIGAGKAPNDRGSLAFTSTGIGVGGDNDATGDYLHFLLPGSDNSRWKFDTSSAFGFTLVSRQNNTFGSGSGTRSSFYTSRTYGVDFLLGYANSLGVTDTVGYRFNTKDSTSAGANDVERFVIENGESKTKSYFDNISVLGVGTSNPSTATTLHVSGDTLVSGGMKVGSTLTIGSLGTGNAVSNLGIDSSGIVVVGDPSSATTFNVFNTSPASPDPKNIYDDGFIRIWFDESSSDDIECEVLTDPSTGKVHFSWDEPSDGTAGAADVNAASGVVSLNQLFENDDRMNLTIWAPSDTTYPYYEMKITKSNSTFTGVPAVLRVNKWNSPT